VPPTIIHDFTCISGYVDYREAAAILERLAWYVKVALVVLSLVIMLGAMFLAMQIA